MISNDISIMKKVFAYLRFSTTGQADGDSTKRQTDAFEQQCQLAGVPWESITLIRDEGVSAFTGKNISEGNLGKFVREVEAGKIEAGTELWVESLDRLSRQGLIEANLVLLSLLKAGIIIKTLMDGQTYSKDNFGLASMVGAGVKQSTSNEESEKKRERTIKNWRTIHANVELGKPMGNRPAWLDLSPDRERYVVNEKKAAVVQSIFDMSINGCGLPKIAKTLNDAGMKPFAMEKRSKGRAEFWTVASVNYILTSRAVFGQFYSPSLDRVFPDHFPVIVSKEDFFRSQAAKTQRRQIGKGQKGKKLTNLFGGIAKCSCCLSPMTIRNPKPGRATQFYCKGTLNGVCKNRPWNYEAFEKNFLAMVNEIDMPEIINGGTASRGNEITAQVQSLKGQKQDLEAMIFNIMNSLEKATGSALTMWQQRMDLRTSELDKINETIKALEAERFTIQEQQRASKETNRIEFASDPDERLIQRTKAAQHIGTLVETILMTKPNPGKFASYVVHFHGGGSRMVHVDFANPFKVSSVVNETDEGTSFPIQPTDADGALTLMNELIAETADMAKNRDAVAAKAASDSLTDMLAVLNTISHS